MGRLSRLSSGPHIKGKAKGDGPPERDAMLLPLKAGRRPAAEGCRKTGGREADAPRSTSMAGQTLDSDFQS